MHAVHASADTSRNGMAQSNGAMVNYLYDLSQITTNHEQFVTDKTIIASPDVHALSASMTLGT
jgi:malonyl-CoA decarboxylase